MKNAIFLKTLLLATAALPRISHAQANTAPPIEDGSPASYAYDPFAPHAPLGITSFTAERDPRYCNLVRIQWEFNDAALVGANNYFYIYRNFSLYATIRAIGATQGTGAAYRMTYATTRGISSGEHNAFTIDWVDRTTGLRRRSPIGATRIVPTTCGAVKPKYKFNAFLIAFPDKPASSEPMLTQAEASNLFTGNGTSLHSHLKENSYGQTGISGKVYDWILLDKPISAYNCTNTSPTACNIKQLLDDSVLKVSKLFPKLDPADMTYFLYHGLAQVSGIVTLSGYAQLSTTFNSHASSTHEQVLLNLTSRLIHETGHIFYPAYLEHSGEIFCGYTGDEFSRLPPSFTMPHMGPCSTPGYGSYSDPMSGVAGTRHFSAYNKEQMGFLSEKNIQIATRPGTYYLDQLELPSKGVKLLKIQMPPFNSSTYYYLEFRQRIGMDDFGINHTNANGFYNRITEGVYAYLRVGNLPNFLWGPFSQGAGASIFSLRSNNNPIDYFDTDYSYNEAITPKSPLIDPYRGIRIDVSGMDYSKSGGQARVEISYIPVSDPPAAMTDPNPLAPDPIW